MTTVAAVKKWKPDAMTAFCGSYVDMCGSAPHHPASAILPAKTPGDAGMAQCCAALTLRLANQGLVQAASMVREAGIALDIAARRSRCTTLRAQLARYCRRCVIG